MEEKDDENKVGEAKPCPPTTDVHIVPPGEVTLLVAGVGAGLALGFALGALFGARIAR